ncbi:MAG: hypothetical protein ABSD92_08125 [Candidatus Bathyarchaeia archaeon]|jgi:hypothetical protein
MSVNRIDETRKQFLRNSELYRQARPIISNQLSNILNGREKQGPVPTPHELFQMNCVDIYEKWKEIAELSNILGDMKRDVKYSTEKHKSIGKMLWFMGLVESLGNTLTDMVLILFIANGKAVHTRLPYVRHVKSFLELTQLDLDYKLNILKEENVSLISKILNLELRNIIADLKFSVDENGIINDQGNNVILIDQYIADFWIGVDTLMTLFEDLEFPRWLETTSYVKMVS